MVRGPGVTSHYPTLIHTDSGESLAFLGFSSSLVKWQDRRAILLWHTSRPFKSQQRGELYSENSQNSEISSMPGAGSSQLWLVLLLKQQDVCVCTHICLCVYECAQMHTNSGATPAQTTTSFKKKAFKRIIWLIPLRLSKNIPESKKRTKLFLKISTGSKYLSCPASH